MIREIIKDTDVLQQVSIKVVPTATSTKELIQDMVDTATEHSERCVGLAAIQIGEAKRVIIVSDGEKYIPYINPVITQYLGDKYEVEEGCMSLEGKRTVTRYQGVEIMHNRGKKVVKERFGGFYAQIIQHEVDHLNGKLI